VAESGGRKKSLVFGLCLVIIADVIVAVKREAHVDYSKKRPHAASPEGIKQILERWHETAAPFLTVMLDSFKTTMRGAVDPDPVVRGVAWELLANHWPTSRKSEVFYARTALSDENQEIRRLALVCLMKQYVNSDDINACAVAAKMAVDTDNSMHLRGMAYLALLLIGGVDFREELVAEVMQITDKFPSDMDWEWVYRCASVYDE